MDRIILVLSKTPSSTAMDCFPSKKISYNIQVSGKMDFLKVMAFRYIWMVRPFKECSKKENGQDLEGTNGKIVWFIPEISSKGDFMDAATFTAKVENWYLSENLRIIRKMVKELLKQAKEFMKANSWMIY